jgi:hypothetical protein
MKLILSNLFDDFEDGPAADLSGSAVEDGSDSSRSSALLADNFTEIFFGDFELNDGRIFADDLTDFYLLWKIDQSPSDLFN